MNVFEYKVVPAPDKGKRGKGIKGGPARFANALELLMNDLAAQGWEYLRTDTLPSEERVGLTGKTTVFQNMLVFRREKTAAKQDVSDSQVTALLTGPKETPAVSAAKVVPTPPAPAPAVDPAATMRDKSTAAAAAAAALRAQRDATRLAPPRGVAAE